MYAQEQYVETPTVEALRFKVQQYLRMSGFSWSENYPAPPEQQQQIPASQQSPVPAVPPPASNAPQQPQPSSAYRQQQQRACFNCEDPLHFFIDCPLKERAQVYATASEFLQHQSIRRMDLPIIPARYKSR